MSTNAVAAPLQPVSPALMSAAEFALKYGKDRTELVRSQVKESPAAFPKHGKIRVRTAYALEAYAGADHGHVMSNDSFVQTGTNPDTVRGADVRASTAMTGFLKERIRMACCRSCLISSWRFALTRLSTA